MKSKFSEVGKLPKYGVLRGYIQGESIIYNFGNCIQCKTLTNKTREFLQCILGVNTPKEFRNF
jgi:uncharacterized ParB-like nuclease family protein